MIPDRERLARTFDLSAELYDEVRPGYPDQLFDDLLQLSATPGGGRILEIGCGTGQATLPLARRGYRILCLEPGVNLAAVARRNLHAFPRVEVIVSSLEEWEVEPEAFDLVMAATSFNWVDSNVRYRKTAEALRPSGCAAVFWHAHVYLPGQDRFFEAVQDVYARYMPDKVGLPLDLNELPTTIDEGFLDPGSFEEVAVRHYPWSETYTTDRYIKVLKTFSNHIALPEDTRTRLLRDVAALIDQEFDGRIVKNLVTVLQVARKVPYPAPD